MRRYEPADHGAVVDLHLAALAGANGQAARGAWDADLDDIERVYLDRGDFLVGHTGGVLAAMGALRPAAPDSAALAAATEAFPAARATAEIKRMRVHPACQRRGYGEAMLLALLARAAELGYGRAVLDTTAGSAAAIALYRKHGFALTGFATMYGMSCVLFARDLRPSPAYPQADDRASR